MVWINHDITQVVCKNHKKETSYVLLSVVDKKERCKDASQNCDQV